MWAGRQKEVSGDREQGKSRNKPTREVERDKGRDRETEAGRDRPQGSVLMRTPYLCPVPAPNLLLPQLPCLASLSSARGDGRPAAWGVGGGAGPGRNRERERGALGKSGNWGAGTFITATLCHVGAELCHTVMVRRPPPPPPCSSHRTHYPIQPFTQSLTGFQTRSRRDSEYGVRVRLCE